MDLRLSNWDMLAAMYICRLGGLLERGASIEGGRRWVWVGGGYYVLKSVRCQFPLGGGGGGRTRVGKVLWTKKKGKAEGPTEDRQVKKKELSRLSLSAERTLFMKLSLTDVNGTDRRTVKRARGMGLKRLRLFRVVWTLLVCVSVSLCHLATVTSIPSTLPAASSFRTETSRTQNKYVP